MGPARCATTPASSSSWCWRAPRPGLSWSTVLHKRAGYRRAFAGFDPEKVARFNRRSVERLVADAGIIRNRLKIEAAIGNARAFLPCSRPSAASATTCGASWTAARW
jgi:3-methyladenine DNA glycosylase Tag